MRELHKNEKDLWTVVNDVCVRTPSWLDAQRFDPGGLHIKSLRISKSDEAIKKYIEYFEEQIPQLLKS